MCNLKSKMLFKVYLMAILLWNVVNSYDFLLANDTIQKPSFDLLNNDSTIYSGNLAPGFKYCVKYNGHNLEAGNKVINFVSTPNKSEMVIIVVGNIIPENEIQALKSKSQTELLEMQNKAGRRMKLLRQGLEENKWDFKYSLAPMNPKCRATTEILYNEMILSLIGDMLNVRLLKLRERLKECPYSEATFLFASDLSGKDKESLCLKIKPYKETKENARSFVRISIDNMIYNPFSPMELDYALQQYIISHKRIYDNLLDMTDIGVAWRIANAISVGNSIPSIETEWKVLQNFESQITVEQCNEMFKSLLNHCVECPY